MNTAVLNSDFTGYGAPPVKTEQTEALLQNIACAFFTERGKFYPDKDFGSRLREAVISGDCALAAACAAQSLYGIDGVYVKSAEPENGEYKITVGINDEERQVTVRI